MFQALAHSRLVKQSEDWHRKVKQREKLGSSGIHWVTQPKPPLLFHFSAPISGIYYHTLFYPLNAWTGHSGTNHNHYNFFKCDWCISCIIFLLSFCTALIGRDFVNISFPNTGDAVLLVWQACSKQSRV